MVVVIFLLCVLIAFAAVGTVFTHWLLIGVLVVAVLAILEYLNTRSGRLP